SMTGWLWAADGRLSGAVTSTDLAEIRGVITKQIEALRRDDAQSAFALVAPGAQQAFRSAEKFLEVVRMAYRAMYRPARISFLDLMVIGDEVVQQVQLTDGSGAIWLAYYAMQRQRDGRWLATG